MSISAAAIRKMVELGLDAQAIAELCDVLDCDVGAPTAPSAIDRRRAWDRERKRVARASSGGQSTGRVGILSTGNPVDGPPDCPPESADLARVDNNNPSTEGHCLTTQHETRASPSDLDRLAEALRAAAGPALANPASSPGLLNLSVVLSLIRPNGRGPPCDLDLDVLPTIAARCSTARPGSIRGWGYFETAIIEARDRRLTGPPPVREVRNEPTTATSPKATARQANLARAFAAADVAAERRAGQRYRD